MEPTLDGAQAQGTRPTFLTVLCILSFIAAGISFILLLLGGAIGGVAESAGATGTGSLWTLLAVSGVLTIASLVGVIQMWKLKKTGFFIYTGSAVAGLIATTVMSGSFPTMSAVFSVLFIVLYGVNLKHLK